MAVKFLAVFFFESAQFRRFANHMQERRCAASKLLADCCKARSASIHEPIRDPSAARALRPPLLEVAGGA